MRRDLDPPTLSEEELIKYYAEAENTLGHITFDPAQQESNIFRDENEQIKQKIQDLDKQLTELKDRLKNNPANPDQEKSSEENVATEKTLILKLKKGL